MPYYLGIDIGTYQSKGVIMDGDCTLIAQASTPHGMDNPLPHYFEHDAEQVWWADFCLLSRELLRLSGLDASDIRAVGASTLGSDCLPVDKECTPLRKAILYGIDARSQAEIAWMTEYYGPEKVRELFGRDICSGDVAAKILWLKNNEPDIHAKAHKFLTGSSYMAAKLTGNFVVDAFLGMASFRPLYREDGTIREDMCAPYCRPEQLAVGKPVISLAGSVTEKAAAETGLRAGTPVIVGTGDSASEAVSTGVVRPGRMMVQFGSSVFMYACTDQPFSDNRMRGNNYLVPGTYSVNAGTNNCGVLQKWYRDTLFPDMVAAEKAGSCNAYDAMLAEAEQVRPGCDGLITLPYFAGERTPINDPRARGMLFGMRLEHTRGHMYRSALEGIGFSVAQHLDVLRENGVEPNRIMAVGGGVKNRSWMQMVADICGRPFHLAEVTVGASYGDALMAAAGVGDVDGFPGIEAKIKVAETFTPDPATHALYKPYRELFDSLYPRERDAMHQLDSIASAG